LAKGKTGRARPRGRVARSGNRVRPHRNASSVGALALVAAAIVLTVSVVSAAAAPDAARQQAGSGTVRQARALVVEKTGLDSHARLAFTPLHTWFSGLGARVGGRATEQTGGVVRIPGRIVGLDGTRVLDKTAYILSLLAGLNLFLFLFNLIPLLPLDGGHVAGAVWESIKRGWAKLRHKPDPGPVDIAKALPVTYVISIFLVGMGALVLLADLIEPISLRG